MKKYLIGIYNTHGSSIFTTINGDTPSRPFSIANNLWNYQTPWTAARRLEMLAQSWEKHGRKVSRFYGTVHDMTKKGNINNAIATIRDFE